MNSIISLLFLTTTTINCSQFEQQFNSDSQKIATTDTCEKKAVFGDIDICLPFIDGMTECYSTPIVKARADKFNYEGNSILAYYIHNKIYLQVDKINEIKVDGYFQIYASNQLKGIRIGHSEFNKMGTMMEGNYLKGNWGDSKKKIDKSLDNISVDKPILIESYSPNIKAKTYAMLTKYQTENEEAVMILIMNMIRIKERVICVASYNIYNGEESIKKAKSKNDYFVLRLLDENREPLF